MVLARNPQRARRAAKPPPTVARATAAVLAQFEGRFAASYAQIAQRWPEIVGATAARRCWPEKLTGRGDRGVLHVAAPGAAAVFVEADAPRILAAVNTFCGATVAGRITIRRAPARAAGPKKAAPRTPRKSAALSPIALASLDAGLEHVAEPRLKAALSRLGRGALAADARKDTT